MILLNSSFTVKAKKTKLNLPLAGEYISAGFPSPAENYIEMGIDLNEYLISHPASTFFLRVSGNSMVNAGIQNDDLLIVDRYINPKINDIVVAILDGTFTLKRLSKINNILYLKSENPEYEDIDIKKYSQFQIWGVAIHSIHTLK